MFTHERSSLPHRSQASKRAETVVFSLTACASVSMISVIFLFACSRRSFKARLVSRASASASSNRACTEFSVFIIGKSANW